MARPKKGESIVSRESILAAAAKLFSERGFKGTTLGDIAAELDATAAALYYHFDSKREILFRYLEAGFEDTLARTDEAMTATEPVERLRQLVRTYVKFDIGAIAGSEMYRTGVFDFYHLVPFLEPDEAARLAKLQRSYLDLFRRTIAAVVDAGAVRDVDVDAAAFAIIGMSAHAVRWYRPSKRLTPDKLADTYADYALAIVRS